MDLISLNKYVVTLIINKGDFSSTNNVIISYLLFDLGFCRVDLMHILPFIEKILLLVRDVGYRYEIGGKLIKELFFQKFVLSSIIRCLKIYPYDSLIGFKVTLFSLKVLFHTF